MFCELKSSVLLWMCLEKAVSFCCYTVLDKFICRRLGAFFQCVDLYTLAPKYKYEATEKLYPVKYLIPWLNNPIEE